MKAEITAALLSEVGWIATAQRDKDGWTLGTMPTPFTETNIIENGRILTYCILVVNTSNK